MTINNIINYVKQLEILALKHSRHKFGDLKGLSNLKEDMSKSYDSASEKHLLEGFFKSKAPQFKCPILRACGFKLNEGLSFYINPSFKTKLIQRSGY